MEKIDLAKFEKDKFDEISYAQDLYRSLLDCMARPGKIGQITPANCGLNLSCNDYVQGLAITLLDQEVTFHLFADDPNSLEQLQAYTQSRLDSMDNCDFFIVNGEQNFAVSRLKIGNLKFPDESATVICQVGALLAEPAVKPGMIKIKLQGPGIRSSQILYVDGLNPELIETWQNCNHEFPLGLDWILVDASGKLSCIPRSSKIDWEVL